MKKNILLSALLLFLLSNSFGQISMSEATKKVNEFISELQIEEPLLYQKPEIVNSKTEIATFDEPSFHTDSLTFKINFKIK